MKFQRALLALSALSLLAAYGCGGQQPSSPAARIAVPALAKGPAVMQERLAIVSKADMDAEKLPAARPLRAGTPDLVDAVYAVNGTTLGAMAKNGVPGETVNGLRKLDGKSYGGTAEFVAAVKDAAGQDLPPASLAAILRNALVVNLADAPSEPKGQVSLDEAVARSNSAAPLRPVEAPAPPPPAAVEYGVVYFDKGTAEFKPEFAAIVKENAGLLIQSKAKATIEGYCDERGSDAFNMALGLRRAQAVLKALVAEGVPASRLKAISHGKDQPADPGHDEAAWAKNRRVILKAR